MLKKGFFVKYPFDWARGKIPIPASHGGSHHLGHSQLLMEVDFPVRHFSGKTFLQINLRVPGRAAAGEVVSGSTLHTGLAVM